MWTCVGRRRNNRASRGMSSMCFTPSYARMRLSYLWAMCVAGWHLVGCADAALTEGGVLVAACMQPYWNLKTKLVALEHLVRQDARLRATWRVRDSCVVPLADPPHHGVSHSSCATTPTAAQFLVCA